MPAMTTTRRSLLLPRCLAGGLSPELLALGLPSRRLCIWCA